MHAVILLITYYEITRLRNYRITELQNYRITSKYRLYDDMYESSSGSNHYHYFEHINLYNKYHIYLRHAISYIIYMYYIYIYIYSAVLNNENIDIHLRLVWIIPLSI